MAGKVCLNADRTKQVPCDSPEAAFVFNADEAEDRMVKEQPATKAAEPTEDKAVNQPAKNRK